jgi:abhydrolase domain-containing protein 12
MTWFKDLDVPEMFGFLRNQVTPFNIRTNGNNLYAWHILPLELYRKYERELQAELSGKVADTTSRLAFKLLRDDPASRLVIHMHGAGGTVGSGYRVPSYHALSAGDRIHVLTFDYRGFGRSTGMPSEHAVIQDALSVVEWALNVANVPPSHIILFGQSLGSAVNTAVAQYYAQRDPPILFAGHIMVASIIDAPSLASTYRIAGIFPLLGPLTRFPIIFDYLRTFIRDEWSTKSHIAEYVRVNEAKNSKYHLTLIHAEDDWDVPWQHTFTVFSHAVNATLPDHKELIHIGPEPTTELGAAGRVVEWRTNVGVIREEILKFGLHDIIMSNPVITLAVMRIFEEV